MKNFYSLVIASLLCLCPALYNTSQTNQSLNLIPQAEVEVAPSNCKASPLPTVIVQPNGSTITIIGKGTMLNSWTETTDGYAIALNQSGNYEYATKLNGDLVAGGTLASDPARRSTAEANYVASLNKGLTPDYDPLKNAVLNQVRAQLQNKTYPTTGNVRVLALLIDYPDLTNTYPKSNFDSLLYASNYRNGDGSFKYFYEVASDSNITIDVDVRGWYRARNNFRYYSRDSGYARAADLVREAVDSAEADGVNFANYDNDSDGDVDGILAVHAGPGAEQGSRTQYIWSHRWVLAGGNTGSVRYDGVFINDYMINPETRTSGSNQNMVGIGVFVHEFGHNLGLPDLYDTDPTNGDSEGIGEWCLMAGGGWLGGEHRPANFSAWCKVENNWSTPTNLTIGSNGTYTLNPANSNIDDIYRINTSLNNEYFLLENRQRLGLDQALRGSGLAIWHINTNKTNSFGNSVNADENLKGVDLEEADGLNDLDNEVNRGDAGDLYPGTSNNTAFDDQTNPNSRTYLFTPTGMQISNITESNNQITFSFGSSSSISACNGGDTITTNNGSFTDGSGTANYANNLSCNWLIQPPGASSITFGLNSIATELNQDVITLYDGVDNTAPLLGTYSGSSALNTFTSNGGSLFVEFTTNGTTTGAGWDAFFTSNGSSAAPTCSGTTTLTSTSGTFDDGSGANLNYTDSLRCSWHINPAGTSTIRLVFDSLNLSAGDSLYIYDGPNASSNLIGAYSGSTIPGFLNSTAADLFVEFITDSTGVTDKGWQLSYQQINGCSGQTVFNSPSGTFTDGSNQASRYQNSLNCSWLIQPTGASIVSLSWNRFRTESGFDFVRIYDGSGTGAPLLGTYSGSNLPPQIISSGGSLFVQFTTDGSVTDLGWEASYTSSTTQCLPNRTLTANNGTFSDGSGTSNYQDNLNCGWLIQPANAVSITINFPSFDTEANVDEVRIYDGVDNTGTLIRAISGNLTPPSTTVNGSAMFVEFITNGTTNAAGWTANYTSTSGQSCSGQTNLTAASGTFDDGSPATSNYSNNLNCSWLIQPTNNPAVIVLNFNRMSVQFGDFIRIYDGANNSGTLLGIRSGTNLGNPLTATSGSMFIEFVTNGFTVAQGWEASYATSSTFCLPTTTFTTNFGSFADGSNNNNYANNTDCEWLIQPATPNLAINLRFTSFSTEAINDSVTIYDGATTSAPILATVSGTNPTIPTLLSSGGSMLVTFKTNGSTVGQGWSAFYSTQARPYCNGQTQLTAASGTFDDGSPAATNYVDNSSCSWLINPTSASRISLSFNRFDTQSGFDTVNVYDGNSTSAPLLGSFSGNSIPPTLISSGGNMLVTFNTNTFTNLTGWEATYNSTSAQCFSNLSLTSYRDTIEDGSGSSNYSNNLNCSWLIQPPSATSITFDFLNIDLLANDSVYLYDGTNNSAPLLGAFSGNTIPASITSTGGNLYVEFITDASGNAAGWRAKYDITSNLSCIGTTILTAANGSFDDGSGTSNYDNNLSCSWLIQPTGNPASITLTVNNNNLANFGDFLRIYDGTNASGTLIGNFFANRTGTVTAFSGSMYLEFTTDNTLTGAGWDVTYSSSSTFCAPNSTFTANFGNFTDGSPIGTNYLPNTNCSWLIQPAATNVAVVFRIFSIDTEAGNDTITVYDGATTSDPILGTFSGSTVPPQVTSSGGDMLVTFNSNGTVNGDGFRAQYFTQQIPFCSGQTVLTAASGTFDDGSPITSNYRENSNCQWLIQPPGAVSTTLNFSRFITEPTNDVVNVYNGSTTNDPLLGSFSGSNLPPTINGGGTMLVEFISSRFTNRNGFEASYNSSTVINLSIAEDTVYMNSGIGNTAVFNINSNTSWQVSENAPWMIPTTINGGRNQAVSVVSTQPNIGPDRSAYAYAISSTSGLSDSVLVIQRGSGRYMRATEDTLYFQANPSPQKFELLANTNWTVSSPSGIPSFNPSSGSNNDSIEVSIPANTSNNVVLYYAALSSSNSTVANDTVVLKQDAQPAVPPSLSTTPDTVTLAQAQGSNGIFTVNSTVTWQTLSSATWLTVNNPSVTMDTNTVQVSAASLNASTADRFAYVAVQDVNSTLFDTVIVRQLGGPLVLDINPNTVNLAQPINSNTTANLTTTLNWTATSADPSWLSVSPASGSGNSNITVSAITANPSVISRSSYIAFEAASANLFDTLWVTQDGITPALRVSPRNILLNQVVNSTDSFTVYSNLNWQTLGTAGWITINNPANTSDTGVVQLIANSANNLPIPRGGLVIVSDLNGAVVDTVFVGQLGTTPTLRSLSDTVLIGGTTGSTASFNLAANLNWNGVDGASWFSSNPSSGSAPAVVTITAQADNQGASQRFSYVAFSENGGSLTDTVVIVQDTIATQTLLASTDTIRLSSANNSTGSFDINSNLSWTASFTASWLNANPTAASQSQTINLNTLSANTSLTPRTTTISIVADNNANIKDSVVVIQEGQSALLNVNPTAVSLNFASGSNAQLSISSNLNWTVSNPATWLSLSANSGSNNGTVDVTATSDNLTGANRTATLTFSAPGVADQFVQVTQIDGTSPSFAVSTDTVYIDNIQGSTASFSVLANATNWSLSETTPWLLVNPTTGSNTQLISLLAAGRNISGNVRVAEITASANGFNDIIVTVIQRAASAVFQTSPSVLVLGSDSLDFVDFNISSNLISWTVEETSDWMEVSPDSGSFSSRIRVTASTTNRSGNIKSGMITVTAPPLVPQNVMVLQDTIITIGLEDLNLEKALSIYPNPSRGLFNIKLENSNQNQLQEASFALYNTLGAVIQVNPTVVGPNLLRIDLSGLKAGFYYLTIDIDGQRLSKKISLLKP